MQGQDLEANGAQAAGSKQSGEGKGRKAQPGSDCLLSFCRVVNGVTGCAALLCLVAHAMALAIAVDATGTGEPQTRDAASHAQLQLLRIYGMGTSFLVLLIETESECVLSWLRACEAWVGRGLLQAFLALLTLELARSTGSSDFDKSLGIYRQVAGFSMLSLAGFYILGGFLCIGWIKKARHRKAMERMRVEKDIEVLDRQREELRSMLAMYAKD